MHKQTAHGGHRGNQARMPREAFHVDALGSVQGKNFYFITFKGTGRGWVGSYRSEKERGRIVYSYEGMAGTAR